MELSFNEYQDLTASTAVYRNKKLGPIIYPSLKLPGEAGEVSEKIGKIIRDGDIDNITHEDRMEIAKEIGDVLWYCAALAEDLGFELGKIAQMNLDKLFDRAKRGVIGGSGDNR